MQKMNTNYGKNPINLTFRLHRTCHFILYKTFGWSTSAWFRQHPMVYKDSLTAHILEFRQCGASKRRWKTS